MDKELEKLSDLEFEYNIARLTKQKKEIIEEAKQKYLEQTKKVMEIEKQQEMDEIEAKK